MSKLLLDLEDCQIIDTGDVLVKYDTLIKRLRSGETVKSLATVDHDDVRLYNKRNKDNPIRIGSVSDNEEMPPVHAYDFNIPEKYLDLDLDTYLAEQLVSRFPDPSEIYADRLALELDMMREREMESVLRVLIYIHETFVEYNVVYGIGRGSSCASLVLFLIGIHMVDPILYNISIDEFLR